MALFGKKRDIKFFSHINKELLNNVIDIQVLVFQLDMEKMKANVYGETDKKIYKKPVKVNCLISTDQPSTEYNDIGINVNQTIQLKFLRDELVSKNLFIEIGDLIYWNDFYYEISQRYENQIFMKRNPQTNIIQNPESFGWNVSIIYSAHLIEKNKIGLYYIIPKF